MTDGRPGTAHAPSVVAGPEIVARMIATYAAASSYADHGVVTESEGADRLSYGKYDWVADHFIKSEASVVRRKTFETAFERPNRFRFEYRVNGNSSKAHVVWTTPSGRARSTWYVERGVVTENATLGMSLAGAAGVSSGVAYVIPALLLPEEVGGLNVGSAGEPRFEVVENIDGHPCFRVTDRGVRGVLKTFWIDIETYLLRRTTTRFYRGNGGRFGETTIHYEPQLDVPLADAQFAPPKTARGNYVRRSTSSAETEHAQSTMNGWLLQREREREKQ